MGEMSIYKKISRNYWKKKCNGSNEREVLVLGKETKAVRLENQVKAKQNKMSAHLVMLSMRKLGIF